MLEFKNVLVGIHFREVPEGSEEQLTSDSEEAVARALMLAEKQGAVLTFAYCFEVRPDARALIEAAEASNEEAFLPAARKTLEKLVARASAKGVTASFEFLFGKPWEELVNKATTDKMDLMVVGTRKIAGYRRALLGSTATRLMAHSPCPVWITKLQPRRLYDNIIIATDLSETSEKVLEAGLQFAAFNGGHVHVLHAVENWFEGRWYRAGYAKDSIMREHVESKDKAKKELDAQVDKILAKLKLDIDVTRYIKSGQPEECIWRLVAAKKADLVVMGIVGRSGMKKYLVGDTAKRILPELSCSLLTVNP